MLVVVVGLVAYFLLSSGHPRTPEEAVDAYIAALNDGDADALAALTPSHVDASEHIAAKLAEHGRQGIQITSVTVSSEIDIRQAIATVEGEGARGTYSESHYLYAKDGRWYVDMEAQSPEVVEG
ncbi:MAG: hypothetical protein ACRDQ7_21860 [Haloechinothrix sp.]